MSDSKDLLKKIAENAEDEFEELDKEIESYDGNNQKKHKNKSILTMSVIICFLFVACVVLLIVSYSITANSALKAYDDEKVLVATDTQEKIKQKIIAAGEERYHTSNEISIMIDDVRKVSSLSVLEVEEVFYYTGSENNSKKSKAWYKFTGTAEYVVNMNLAEIIVDEERQQVLIRVPYPVLKDKIKMSTKEYLFEKYLFEDVADGVEIAVDAEKKAKTSIEKSIRDNQMYFEHAKIATRDQLTELVEMYNPNMTVDVDVEFFD